MKDRLIISPPERRELNSMVRSRTVRAEDSQRARIILQRAAGSSLRTVAREVACSVNTVRLWESRFRDERLGGLYSRHEGRQPRSGQ